MGDTYLINFTRGNKFFEIANHLGNVMLTVTDKREPVPVSGNPSVIASYKADVMTAADYSPFGMTLPGRAYNNHWQKYRYGFNGKESDSEVNGPYNELDYGNRVYEPRLGRFLSVDPITHYYPFYSPYHYAGNNPIYAVDLDGLEPKGFHFKWVHSQYKGATATYLGNPAGQIGYNVNITNDAGKTVYTGVIEKYNVRDIDNKLYRVYEAATADKPLYWSQEINEQGEALQPGRVVSFTWNRPNMHDAELAGNLSAASALTLAGAFGAPISLEGVGSAYGVVQSYALNIAAKTALNFYKYGPAIGTAGRIGAEF
ncbi:MAG: RHS repeat-associated core domain-containing protein [Chitinophagaceae bacterium]|nr:RHS repeat-associated core domain-containing protein [Chitinophagaceae bacterium]